MHGGVIRRFNKHPARSAREENVLTKAPASHRSGNSNRGLDLFIDGKI
jgi:hypothetical protein